jgi:TRAP-type uncharacterized transport system substrate-binding protein
MYFNENNTRFHNKNNEIAQQKAEIDQRFDSGANDMLCTAEIDATIGVVSKSRPALTWLKASIVFMAQNDKKFLNKHFLRHRMD